MDWTYALGAISAAALIAGTSYFNGPVRKLGVDLTGQIIVITGATRGLGYETAKILSGLNATIIMANRSKDKTMPIIKDLQLATGNKNIEFMQLDVSDFDSIQNFSANFKKKYQTLNTLLHNAGIAITTRETNKEGIEKVMMTNYFAPFYLSHSLLDVLKSTPKSRIVSVNSMLYSLGHIRWEDFNYEKDYKPTTYFDSKLALLMFTQEFQRRFGSLGIKNVTLHPGVVRTEPNKYYLGPHPIAKAIARIFSPVFWYFTKDPVHGAQTHVHCVIEPYEQLVGGGYYSDCKLKKVDGKFSNEENNAKLYDLTKKFLAEKGYPVPEYN